MKYCCKNFPSIVLRALRGCRTEGKLYLSKKNSGNRTTPCYNHPWWSDEWTLISPIHVILTCTIHKISLVNRVGSKEDISPVHGTGRACRVAGRFSPHLTSPESLLQQSRWLESAGAIQVSNESQTDQKETCTFSEVVRGLKIAVTCRAVRNRKHRGMHYMTNNM